MNDWIQAIGSSKKYASVSPDAVRRICAEAAAKHKKPKEAEKAARTALHQMTGAFMTDGQLKDARRLLERFAAGEQSALDEALKLHASTRERLPEAQAMYQAIFGAMGGAPGSIVDLACGLNPILLGSMGLSVCGLDVHGGLTALVTDWGKAMDWPISAQCADLIAPSAIPSADLALAMKLLPVLERQKKGSAMALLESVQAAFYAITFPTRSIGGRNVGMEDSYSAWFEGALPGGFRILQRWVIAHELIYLVQRGD